MKRFILKVNESVKIKIFYKVCIYIICNGKPSTPL